MEVKKAEGRQREEREGRKRRAECGGGGARRREFLGYYGFKPLGMQSSNIPNERVSVSRYPEPLILTKEQCKIDR